MATIQAHIERVEQEIDSDWFRIYTDDPRVKKLSTKIREKAAEAAELKKSGELAEIAYTERTKPNPKGGEFHDFYLDRAASIDNGASDDGIDVVSPTRAKVDWETSWRMSLAIGVKAAVATLPEMPPDQRSFEVQQRIALAWARFHIGTPPPPEGQHLTPPSPTLPDATDHQWGEAPSEGDDGIPF